MCGIAGWITPNNKPEQAYLDQISHRGPDDAGFYQHKNLVLGHRRLSIQDLSEAGHQPMHSADGRYTIIFNGEIYNHWEIRKRLKQKEYRSSADTETLLYGFIEQGQEILNKLNGIFAFAILDREEDQLFIARDQFGVKPLYYYSNGYDFFFSSEIKSFSNHPLFKDGPSPEGLANYIHFLWSPGEQTAFHKVKKLKPGHLLELDINDPEQFNVRKYYQVPFTGIYSQASEEELIKQTQEKLEQAVKRQLLSDVPVGFFLSGGLDSSALVAMARKLMPDKKIQCFTIDTSELEKTEGFANDLDYAKKVAAHLNVDLEIVKADVDIVRDFDKMIWHLDEPQADAAPLNVLNICRRAREMGYKVLIGGAAGDDLFSGYRRHQALSMEKMFSKIPQPLGKTADKITRLLPADNPIGRRARKLTSGLSLTTAERMANYFSWLPPDKVINLFNKDFWNSVEKSVAGFPLQGARGSGSKAGRSPLQGARGQQGPGNAPERQVPHLWGQGMHQSGKVPPSGGQGLGQESGKVPPSGGQGLGQESGKVPPSGGQGAAPAYTPSQVFQSLTKEIPHEKNLLNQMLYWELNTFLVDHNLNYTDKLGMAEGVEIRVPFLDKDLVEFSTTIPPSLKLKGRTTKYILKKAMEDYLPHEVIYRPKAGFGAPVRKWITEDLKHKLEEELSKENIDRTGIFNYHAVWELIIANTKGKVDASYSIWAILAIQSWYKQFYKPELGRVEVNSEMSKNFESQSGQVPLQGAMGSGSKAGRSPLQGARGSGGKAGRSPLQGARGSGGKAGRSPLQGARGSGGKAGRSPLQGARGQRGTMHQNATPPIFQNAQALRRNMTSSENLLWEHLSNNKLGVKFRRQHPISSYIADFYCHAKKLIIEVDGEIHLNPEVQRNDQHRTETLNELGIKVIRFTNDEVNSDIEAVLKKIKKHL